MQRAGSKYHSMQWIPLRQLQMQGTLRHIRELAVWRTEIPTLPKVSNFSDMTGLSTDSTALREGALRATLQTTELERC